MPKEFSWAPPPLTADEERLVSLYKEAERSLDDLPYTEEFEELVEKYGSGTSREARHDVLKQLLRLRKQGRLPRIIGRYH